MHGIRLRPDSLGDRAARPAVQPHRRGADVPLVGERRRGRQRRLPVVLPDRRARRRRPRQARGDGVPRGRPARTTGSTTRPARTPSTRTATGSTGTATSRCPPRTWRSARRTTSSAATTTAAARASCTGPTTRSHPARSSGPGATARSAGRGTRTSPTPTGPYVELMAGVFTDNQPDFSFLAPGRDEDVQPVLVPDPGDRSRPPGQPRGGRPPRRDARARRPPPSGSRSR